MARKVDFVGRTGVLRWNIRFLPPFWLQNLHRRPCFSCFPRLFSGICRHFLPQSNHFEGWIWLLSGAEIINFEGKAQQNGGEAQAFRLSDTFAGSPKQGLSRASDSKARAKAGFSGNGRPWEVRWNSLRKFLKAHHGVNASTEKIFWNDGDFQGLQWWKNGVSGLFSYPCLTSHGVVRRSHWYA